MALLDTYHLSFDSTLRARIAGGCWKSAADILNESPSTTNHTNRVLWAKKVLTENADGPMVRSLSVNCAQNATIAAAGAAAATDNDILFVIDSLVDTYADGVYGTT